MCSILDKMYTAKKLCLGLLVCCLLPAGANLQAAGQPNIVLVFMDNFGWGEPGFNGGGIIRGAPTPRLDQLAGEGLRLTNFNVEVQCTPSRSALMTWRYAIRSGNGTVPLGEGVYGLVQWEVTMAEMLADLAGADPRHVWTPTEPFLKRLTGAQLEAIHTEIIGEAVPSFTKMKKGEKAKLLHRIFAGEKGIPPLTEDQRARAAAWLPEGMATGSARHENSNDLQGAA